ncbi:MAG: response regulator [Desulfuromonas sp.]|nr:response regulator [Desulfuromonas sp.]
MSRRLLLADDSVTIQKVIEITLSDKDYILRVASDGDEAMRMANNETPDLIMADVFMPGKNGYEVCEAVRSTPALQAVPVLLLAGTFEPFDQKKAEAVGANGWIVKPFSSQALIDKVEELLALAPAQEQWQVTPSTASGDQDILQALEEVTASQSAAATPATAIEPVFEGAVDFELDSAASEPLEPAVPAPAVEPTPSTVEPEPFSFSVEEEPVAPAVSADPFAARADTDAFTAETSSAAEPIAEPFAGFDVAEESAPLASEEAAVSPEPEPFTATEPTLTVPASSEPLSFAAEEELVPTELGEDIDDFSFNEEPAPVAMAETPVVAAAEPDLEAQTPAPAPLGALPSLDEFQAAEPANDNVVQLREEDIVAEGAYGSEPARVEKRVAFLSDEQLTEIVERVAGAVIERLAAPLLEQVIWEVVPDLAESMVREEMAKIKSDA